MECHARTPATACDAMRCCGACAARCCARCRLRSGAHAPLMISFPSHLVDAMLALVHFILHAVGRIDPIPSQPSYTCSTSAQTRTCPCLPPNSSPFPSPVSPNFSLPAAGLPALYSEAPTHAEAPTYAVILNTSPLNQGNLKAGRTGAAPAGRQERGAGHAAAGDGGACPTQQQAPPSPPPPAAAGAGAQSKRP